MEFNQLKYFLAAAEEEHITNAAKRLNIAQPALTRAIHKLEEELGIKLFERTGRNIRLTPEGIFLKQRISPALADLSDLAADVQSFATNQQNVLHLCIRSASNIVIDAVAEFAEQHPKVSFRVSQDDRLPTNDFVIETIGASPITSSFVTSLSSLTLATSRKNLPSTKEEHFIEVARFTERICLALPAQDNRTSPLPLETLRNDRFICLANTSSFRTLCDERCQEHGFKPHVIFESDNPSVVRKMIGLGLGVGFWPEHSWGTLNKKDAKLVAVDEPTFTREIILAKTSRTSNKAILDEFEACLVKKFTRAWGD